MAAVHVGGLIVGVVCLVFGGGAGCIAVALIRNLNGLGDKLLRQYADHPGRGGWRRVSASESFSSEGTPLLAFHYIPKTMRQVRRAGWALLFPALFIATVGLLFTVGSFTGAVT
jgi:hypothetical protein